MWWSMMLDSREGAKRGYISTIQIIIPLPSWGAWRGKASGSVHRSLPSCRPPRWAGGRQTLGRPGRGWQQQTGWNRCHCVQSCLSLADCSNDNCISSQTCQHHEVSRLADAHCLGVAMREHGTHRMCDMANSRMYAFSNVVSAHFQE